MCKKRSRSDGAFFVFGSDNIIGDTYILKIVLTKLYYTMYSIINQTILISHII